MRFTGSISDLETRIASLLSAGQWNKDDPRQVQLRHNGGGIMNWFPNTGTINFQGKPEGRAFLEATVQALLELEKLPESCSASSQDSPSLEAQQQPNDVGPQPFAQTESASNDTDQLSLPKNSELVIALVGAVGSRLGTVMDRFREILKSRFNYRTETISVSKDIIASLSAGEINVENEFLRIQSSMDAGNRLRQLAEENAFLALAASERISQSRKGVGRDAGLRTAYIVSSLKHPAEVQCLRDIYGPGFFLVSVYENSASRARYLSSVKNIDSHDVSTLLVRDANESAEYGQHTTDVFHMADYFLHFDDSDQRLSSDVMRFLELAFGHPYVTPTFDEYATFMAFSSALRSADLSRQVGAVIARDQTILSTGANDVPKFGGGLYSAEYDKTAHAFSDKAEGRDYVRGVDPNVRARNEIIDDIVERVSAEMRDEVRQAIEQSKLKDITEYGRCVHAEMDALIACARERISTVAATLYSTTFPCHNCAKHIIAAGIRRVVFVEPYPKSKALDFHKDSVVIGFECDAEHLVFEPFVGVGPHRFFDLFSMNLGSGYPLTRKNKNGTIVKWLANKALPRLHLDPYSYIQREQLACRRITALKEKLRNR